MQRRILSYSALVIFLEIMIYFWSMSISELDAVKYSLASRFSARVTLVMFEGLLIWIGLKGLKCIYDNEKQRRILTLLISLIAVNHLIHFVFLAINHWVNSYDLFTIRSAGGAIGYLILVVAPFYLSSRKQLTIGLYGLMVSAFLFIDIIALVSYIGRWNKDLPMASSKEIYVGIMVSIGLILLMNVYRIFAERKIKLNDES